MYFEIMKRVKDVKPGEETTHVAGDTIDRHPQNPDERNFVIPEGFVVVLQDLAPTLGEQMIREGTIAEYYVDQHGSQSSIPTLGYNAEYAKEQ